MNRFLESSAKTMARINFWVARGRTLSVWLIRFKPNTLQTAPGRSAWPHESPRFVCTPMFQKKRKRQKGARSWWNHGCKVKWRSTSDRAYVIPLEESVVALIDLGGPLSYLFRVECTWIWSKMPIYSTKQWRFLQPSQMLVRSQQDELWDVGCPRICSRCRPKIEAVLTWRLGNRWGF